MYNRGNGFVHNVHTLPLAAVSITMLISSCSTHLSLNTEQSDGAEVVRFSSDCGGERHWWSDGVVGPSRQSTQRQKLEGRQR